MKTETTGNTTSAPAMQGVTGVSDGNSELDNLLREHSEASQTATQPTSNVSEMSALTNEVRELRKERTQDREREADRARDDAVNALVDFVVEPTGTSEAAKDFAKGFIYNYAEKHSDFSKAFDDRTQNPDAYESHSKAVQKGFGETLKSLNGSDAGIIDDIEAAEAAVSGSTTETRSNGEDDGPTPAQKSRMSTREWDDYLAKKHGYTTQ